MLNNPDSYVGKAYLNEKGNAECVEFIRQQMGAPPTKEWIEGPTVAGNPNILPGTAIGIFINGAYPQDGTGHAAVIKSQDAKNNLNVVDQWHGMGLPGGDRVAPRTIWRDNDDNKIVNNKNNYKVIKW